MFYHEKIDEYLLDRRLQALPLGSAARAPDSVVGTRVVTAL